MADYLIPVVDEQDNIIEYKKRSEIKKEDIYRVSALWIENSRGQVLLAQRAFTKKNDPGKWGPAVAGTVEKGETYESNILKEAEEEIGLTNTEFKLMKKNRQVGEHNYFSQYYYALVDKEIDEFKFDKIEVNDLKWFDKSTLRAEIAKHPDLFLKSMAMRLDMFLNS